MRLNISTLIGFSSSSLARSMSLLDVQAVPLLPSTPRLPLWICVFHERVVLCARTMGVLTS